MKYVDEFRNPELIEKTAKEIAHTADPNRHYRIMEVCGGHTHSIYRFGLQALLPDSIELIHGPGCPVCVLPMARVDDGLKLAEDPRVILTAFGDMMRVPGTQGTPLELKARGADIRMVYSPLDALKLAETHPDKEVIFFAIGFETTTPSTALTLKRAKAQNQRNFSVFNNHILVNPAIKAVLDAPDMHLDGFIGPGHVSTVIGCETYEYLGRDYGKPIVVSGFEPLDLLQSMLMVLKQLNEGRAEVENQYGRAIQYQGNKPALAAIDETMTLREHFEWRGLGSIPFSAYQVRDSYRDWDAEAKFTVDPIAHAEPEEAPCGDVLRGKLKPHQCALFGTTCTPERPVGALMVSSEGACAAYYHYVHRQAELA